MENLSFMRLDLRSPLLYETASELMPFDCSVAEGQEFLFCFEIDPEQAARIDPDPDRFLGKLIFAAKEGAKCEGGKQGKIQLAAGHYLFTQQRRALNREECLDMAIEQHKDGLWERHKLEDRLYIRCLFEDGSPVTQIFRPLSVI